MAKKNKKLNKQTKKQNRMTGQNTKKYFGKGSDQQSTLPGQELLPPLTGLTESRSQTQPQPIIFDQTMIDGTCATEYTIMRNDKYAPQIIQKIMRPEIVKNILALKAKNKIPEFLSEGKKTIIEICKGIDSLKTHTSMFIVIFMMAIGRILNEIYDALGSDRSKYAKWVKINFGSQHRRYFQQARQLVAMGEFATKYASLGKNRLLQVNRIQNLNEYKAIIDEYKYPDLALDMKGKIFTEHTDAVITLYNLKQGGIDFADFDQAYLLGTFNKQWIEQKTIKKIKDWLDKFPTPEEKKQKFDDYVMNMMTFPSESEYQPVGNLQSLNKILADLISYNEKYIENGQMDGLIYVDEKIWTDAVKTMGEMIKNKKAFNIAKAKNDEKGLKK
jgi:hypothetical protein